MQAALQPFQPWERRLSFSLMPTLSLRDIPDNLDQKTKELAERERHSINKPAGLSGV